MNNIIAGFNSGFTDMWGDRFGALIRSYSCIVPLNWWDKYGTLTLIIGGGLIVTTTVYLLHRRGLRK